MHFQLSEPITNPPPLPIKQHFYSHRPQKHSSLSFQAPNATKLTTHTHLSVFDRPINSSTYALILESCRTLNLGKQLHAHTLRSGFGGHEFMETKLLQMYGRFGCLEDAELLFDKMQLRNLYSWTAMLSLYVDHGLFEEAFWLFEELQIEDVSVEFFVFPLALKVSSGLGMEELGRQLHGIVIKHQFVSNLYVGNALIDMYGKCGNLDDARKVFGKMPEKDCVSRNSILTACAANGMVYEALDFLERMSLMENSKPNLVSWSAVIGGFSQNGYDEEATELLLRMQAEGIEPNERTIASVLPACARLQKLSLGKEFHGYVTRHGMMSNFYIVNGLIDIYRRCADIKTAFKLFSKFSAKNAVSCNTIVVGYCENGYTSEARELFDRMELLGIRKDIISWNSMISGYVDNFQFDEAMSMFKDLLMEDGIKPNSFTLGSALTACADTVSLRLGKELHSQAIVRGLQSNTFVGGALVEMYCRCHDLMAAQKAFNEVTVRDTATWNALISGYSCCNQIEDIQHLLQKMCEDGFGPNIYTWNGTLAGHVENGLHETAMHLFSEMQASNMWPDIYTVGIILSACSRLASIDRGKQIHAHSVRCSYDADVHIGAALVDMYAKCGSIRHALLAYERIPNPNLVSHNAMLTAYAMHGHGEDGIALFRKMLENGFRPDQVTFLSVLSSCVHIGLVDTAQEFFDLMQYYDIKPTIKHYTCMIDLLSRTGQLSKAYELIKNAPMKYDSVLWSAFLGGCVTHHNMELGEIAAEKLIELEPDNTGNYIMLANLYAFDGRWADLARTRQKMKDRGMHKNPGCSWIEDRDDVHVFLAHDKSHKRKEDIYATLDNLTLHMKS
ncbi:hypothetical protein SLA2020_155690 [Shorea laevis]